VAHDRPVILPFRPDDSSVRPPAILLTSYMTGAAGGKNLGMAGYSYDIVTQKYMPLLERLGEVIPVPHPRRNLETAVGAARRRGLEPVHLSFLPFQDVQLARSAPNVVVPAWEFPDVPDYPFGGNPQNDWPATANRCSLILVGGPFTADALRRAGTVTPIRIVQVPTPAEYFDLPAWDPAGQVSVDCKCYTLPQESPVRGVISAPAPRPAGIQRAGIGKIAAPSRGKRMIKALGPCARWLYKRVVRPGLSERAARSVRKAWEAGRAAWKNPPGAFGLARRTQLDLSGIVYTSILNPNDGRKNWQDLLTGFLLGLGDCPDATLVVKLITSDPDAVSRVLGFYKGREIPHRCKLVFVIGYLSEEQLLALAEGSTYYLQTTRAEGNCLPLMNYLSAARPGISPRHSAMLDYFDDKVGFVVDSHPEPAAWPHDPWLRTRTTWGRIVWPSLVEQLRESYRVAKEDRARYDLLAGRGRQRMFEWVGPDSIEPRLRSALDLVRADNSSTTIERRLRAA